MRRILVVYTIIASLSTLLVMKHISNTDINTDTIKQTEEVTRIVAPIEELPADIVYHIRPAKSVEKPAQPIESIDEPIEESITTEVIEQVVEPQPWWTEEELDMLAAVVYYEAGSNDCTDRHQQLVAQVVLNRVASNEFPDNIYDVVTQQNPTQYSVYKLVLKNMGNRDIVPQRCYDNALVALKGNTDCPSNIVWQANFKQGSEIYEVHKTSYSTTYFCYR